MLRVVLHRLSIFPGNKHIAQMPLILRKRNYITCLWAWRRSKHGKEKGERKYFLFTNIIESYFCVKRGKIKKANCFSGEMDEVGIYLRCKCNGKWCGGPLASRNAKWSLQKEMLLHSFKQTLKCTLVDSWLTPWCNGYSKSIGFLC